MRGIWEVIYESGRVLNQYDQSAPEFNAVEGAEHGGEVPFRTIDWNQVKTLVFYDESGAGQMFEIPTAPEGFQYTLRSRTFVGFGNQELSAFILLCSVKEQPVNDDTVASSFYWFPDFTSHFCTKFDCPAIRKWASSRRLGLTPDTGLPLIHGECQVAVDTTIA